MGNGAFVAGGGAAVGARSRAPQAWHEHSGLGRWGNLRSMRVSRRSSGRHCFRELGSGLWKEPWRRTRAVFPQESGARRRRHVSPGKRFASRWQKCPAAQPASGAAAHTWQRCHKACDQQSAPGETPAISMCPSARQSTGRVGTLGARLLRMLLSSAACLRQDLPNRCFQTAIGTTSVTGLTLHDPAPEENPGGRCRSPTRPINRRKPKHAKSPQLPPQAAPPLQGLHLRTSKPRNRRHSAL